MKLALSVNIISPYRLPIYSAIAEEFDTLILHGGQEANRSWVIQVPERMKAEKVWTLHLPIKKQTGVPGIVDTSYVQLNLGLLWALPRFRPDIIVTNEMGLRTAIAILYGKLACVPVWIWSGGTLHTERYVRRWRRLWRKLIALNANRWISYGAAATEYLESLEVKREAILQIQNCVRQETFQQVTPANSGMFLDKPRPVILTVGQLIERKGLDKLIEACGRMVARGREFTLVIVGKGPEQDRLCELAVKNRIRDFMIVPNQSQPELNSIYRSADAFVFPTMEDVWGLVVNEAIWTGLPVLCSKYAGCATEIVHGENIFDPMSADEFDQALERIFDGSLCPSDVSRLKRWQEVSKSICTSLRKGAPAS